MHKYITQRCYDGIFLYLKPEYILSAVKGLHNEGIISSAVPFILSQVTVPK